MEEKNDTAFYAIMGIGVIAIIFLVFRKKTGIDPANAIPSPLSSTSAEWILWHKALLKYGYPQDSANMLFLQAFNSSGAKDVAAINDYTLRTYMQEQGIQLAGYSVASGAYDTVVGTGVALDKGVGTIGKFFAAGVFVAVLIIALVMWQLFKPEN